MEKADSPGKSDTGQGEPCGQPLQPPGDATDCHHPQGSNNERPSFREQLCHKRLLASLPRLLISAEPKLEGIYEMAENLQRLCIVSGLYVDFAGADAGGATCSRSRETSVIPDGTPGEFRNLCFATY